MKLKTAKIVYLIGFGLTLLFFILCSVLHKKVYIYIAVAFAFASVASWMVFGRCPSCGRHLGRVETGQYCPHCGKKLEE